MPHPPQSVRDSLIIMKDDCHDEKEHENLKAIADAYISDYAEIM